MTRSRRHGRRRWRRSRAGPVTEKINYRLLANTIAHQWWGASVSPATRDDWWISDGFARYSEADVCRVRCRQWRHGRGDQGHVGGRARLRHGAAWPASASSILFSPEFQTLVTDKGGMILHMLRWVVGDQKFDPVDARLRISSTQGKPATMEDFQQFARSIQAKS